MASFEEVAKEFVRVYYNAFDTNKSSLAALYRDRSMLTFEGSQSQGAQKILEKLEGLGFSKAIHETTTLDAQPSLDNNSVLVLVTGRLLVDEEQTPMSFSQMFQLVPDGSGSYYIANDVFRLVYAAH